jgi:hypothetical protein
MCTFTKTTYFCSLLKYVYKWNANSSVRVRVRVRVSVSVRVYVCVSAYKVVKGMRVRRFVDWIDEEVIGAKQFFP